MPRLVTVSPRLPPSRCALRDHFQILCALLNQNSDGRRFSFLNARRVLIVADPPDGEVRREERIVLIGRVEFCTRLACFCPWAYQQKRRVFGRAAGRMDLTPSDCYRITYLCVFFTLYRSFYPSTSSTTIVRADSPILERPCHE